MNDYAPHLIAARAALRYAEECANRHEWQLMAEAAYNATAHTYAIEHWAKARATAEET